MASCPPVVTPQGRFSYMFLWEARAHKDATPDPSTGAVPRKFNTNMLFAKTDDLSAIIAAHASVKAEAYPDFFPKGARGEHPLKDGAVEYPPGHPDHAMYKDFWILNMGRNESYGRPDILDANNVPITVQSDFYSGCYGQAVVSFYSYKGGTGGINCEVHGVKKLVDGELLGTAPVDSVAMFGGSNTPAATPPAATPPAATPPAATPPAATPPAATPPAATPPAATPPAATPPAATPPAATPPAATPPAATPPAATPPAATPPAPVMTEKAGGQPYDQWIAGGWTDLTLREHGYMV